MADIAAESGEFPDLSQRRKRDEREEWRELLRDHAGNRWRAVVATLASGKPFPPRDDAVLVPLIAALGEVAEEALGIVDRFALGAAAEASASGKAVGKPDEDFTAQLELIIDGFEPRHDRKAVRQHFAAAESHSEEARPRVFQSDLWQLLHKIRESAEMSYSREIDLVELDRRILFMLRTQGPLVPAGLSSAVGVDKAQVSRSVKRLLDLDLVQREQIRSPITLTPGGIALTDRLLRLAALRNRELAFDVSDEELSQFFGVMEVLLDRAVSLYETERDMAENPELGEGRLRPPLADRRAGEPIVIDRSRIVSPLLTLSSYFSRSGALAFKRLTGLSSFEAWVLSEIAYDPPTDWPRLVKALERDHSQAGRTVTQLVERGLAVREGKPGRRHGRFSPTEEGRRLYKVIVELGAERSNYLLSALGQERLAGFLATFDKVKRNAAAQLERERALEEIDGN